MGNFGQAVDAALEEVYGAVRVDGPVFGVDDCGVCEAVAGSRGESPGFEGVGHGCVVVM